MAEFTNIIMAVMATVVAVVTIAYAMYTKRIVKEMQATREAEFRPYLIIDVVCTPELVFDLVIKNNGKTAAQKVSFKIDKDIEGRWRNRVNEMPLFKEGIAFFPPGKEFVVAIGPSWRFLGKEKDTTKHPLSFAISCKYSYFGGLKTVEESMIINLEEYMNTSFHSNEIAKSIKKLGENVEKHLNEISKSAEKLSKIEAIASPSGLDISQVTLHQISKIFDKEAKEKIKFNLNLATHYELVGFLELEPKVSEQILIQREIKGQFESFDELKGLEGITDAVVEKIKKYTFIG